MNATLKSTAFLIVFSVRVALASEPSAPTVQAVTAMLDDLFRSSSTSGRLELISTTETQSRHLKMRIWTQKRNKALIVIDEPVRESGIATLKVDQNLWNYLPKINRTMRVPPSMMLSSWMGTDFTNDDLVKDTSYESDFDAEISGRSADPDGWLVVLKVKPDRVGRWDKIEAVVRDDAKVPLLARYYDRKGRLARTIFFRDVRKFGNREIPTRLLLNSVDQPGHRTELHYLELNFDVPVADSLFSLSELEKK